MTLSSMRMAVLMVVSSLASSSVPSASMCCGRLTEPRLHTAISLPGEVLSVISVHRLDECTTPRCCCGLRRLHGSLKQNHGWPVSNRMDSILRHSLTEVVGLQLVFTKSTS